MEGRAVKGSRASVREVFCGHTNRQRLSVGCSGKLAAITVFHLDRLSFRRPAQLVRAALLVNAVARALRPLEELFRASFRGHLRSHARVCLAAGALLHKSLVRRQLADSDGNVEHLLAAVDWSADDPAREAKLPARLVVGNADRVYLVRFELARAGIV